MRIAVLALALLLAGCASTVKPSIIHKVPAPKAKHVEPCPCSPTANQVVTKRWYDGFKVKLFH